MIYAGFFILTFTAAQLLIALVNLLFSQPFPKKSNNRPELVSVLIPVRNEEHNIKNLLEDLQQQKYPYFEILLFNDQSTDNTEQILKQFATRDKRIRYLNSEGLPDGWLGKNFGCHSLSKEAKGRYLLYLDADVRVGKSIIEKLQLFSQEHRLSLVSVFPTQVMKTIGEKITVPNMNYILLTLLPLILVRKSHFPSLAAANGQCMFFFAEDYNQLHPHKLNKLSAVEDIEIARLLKRKKKKVACLAGSPDISCRMYSSYNDAVNGFSKNVIMFFSNSYLASILFWLVTTWGFIAVYLSFPLTVFLIYLGVILLIRVVVSAISNQSILQNLLLIIPQQLTIGIFIFKAIINKYTKQHKWKGRNISYF
jgi:glycosyltransferase involved in cell wall biosynthesis